MPDITSAATQASGATSTLDTVGQGAQIAGQIATVLAGIGNQKQQLKAQQAYQALSIRQQSELNQKIADASSNNERLKIIVDALVSTKNAAATGKASSWLVPTLIGVGFLAVVGTLVVLRRKGHKGVKTA